MLVGGVVVSAACAVAESVLPRTAALESAGTAGAVRAGVVRAVVSGVATGLPAARVTAGPAFRLMKKAGAMAIAIIRRIAQRVRRSMVSLDQCIRGRDRRRPDETGGIARGAARRATTRGARRGG